jgi:hypothetical protein
MQECTVLGRSNVGIPCFARNYRSSPPIPARIFPFFDLGVRSGGSDEMRPFPGSSGKINGDQSPAKCSEGKKFWCGLLRFGAVSRSLVRPADFVRPNKKSP